MSFVVPINLPFFSSNTLRMYMPGPKDGSFTFSMSLFTTLFLYTSFPCMLCREMRYVFTG